MPRDGSATRAEIQRTALHLFVEQGYDATSLREIADAVGVTKAALYYHFRTKDDIVRAVLGAYAAQLDALVTWVEEQPPGPERSAGFVDRLVGLVTHDGGDALRFGQANPTVMERFGFAETQIGAVRRLTAALAGPTPDAEASLRALLAFGAVLVGVVGRSQLPFDGDPETVAAAGRAVALDLLRSRG